MCNVYAYVPTSYFVSDMLRNKTAVQMQIFGPIVMSKQE